MRKIIVIFLIILTLAGVTYFIFQEGKISINNERAGFMLLRGGYRAWWIRYSNGLRYPYHGFKANLWCWPRFEYCDVRPLLDLAPWPAMTEGKDDLVIDFTLNVPDTEAIIMHEADTGDLILIVNHIDFIRLSPNGDFYIKGKKTTDDIELYKTFKKWLEIVMDFIDEGGE